MKTPIPWRFYEGAKSELKTDHNQYFAGLRIAAHGRGKGEVLESGDCMIAMVHGDGPEGSGKANAEFIVHAVNNIERVEKERDELLEAAKKARSMIHNPDIVPPKVDSNRQVCKVLQQLDQAIRKASGENEHD